MAALPASQCAPGLTVNGAGRRHSTRRLRNSQIAAVSISSSHLCYHRSHRLSHCYTPDSLQPSVHTARNFWGRKLTLTAADLLVMTGQVHRCSRTRHLALLLSPAVSNLRSGRTRRHFRSVRKIAKTGLLASSCLSVRPRGTALLPLDGFALNFVLEAFTNICPEYPSHITI